MKTLVVYWGRKTESNIAIEYIGTPGAEILFCELLDMFLKNGIKTYFSRDISGYLGMNKYNCQFVYEGNTSFKRINEVIEPEIVWDKSVGQMFPVVGDDTNVINSNAFKTLVSNKWFSYLSYQSYFPKTVIFNSEETFKDVLRDLNTESVVVKPATGYGGYGVRLVDRNNPVLGADSFSNKNTYFLAQDFMETGVGIKGIVEGRHDLRVIIVNGIVVKSFLRTPKSGDFRSNWSQGGTFNQVLIQTLPGELLAFIKPLIEEIKTKYNNPYFAIDVANTKDGYKIIELTGSAVSFADNLNDERDLWFSELTKRFLD